MSKSPSPILPPQDAGQDSGLARRATALMTQWVFERTEDQASFARMGAAAAGCITYATAVAFGIASQQPLCGHGGVSTAAHPCNTLPPPLLIAAPLPLWFLFSSILIALKGVQRRQATIELLELEIGHLNSREGPWPLHPSTRTDAARMFYDLFHTRCVQIVMYGGALLVAAGATVGAALLLFYEVDAMPVRAGTVAVYALMMAILFSFAIKRPRNPHAEILASLRKDVTPERSSDEPPQNGRGLLSYLAMPRPRYLVKWLFFPVTFGLAAWAEGGASGRALIDAALLLVALEYLIYPARYQWNDVRGFADDGKHPDWLGRGRLPHGLTPEESRRIILASLAVAAGRLLAAVGIGILQPHLLLPIGGLIAAVFLTAAAYERLRVQKRVIALWMFVGVGYAIRGVSGLVTGGLPWDETATLAGAVSLAAFGTSFVTMTWALEALAHCEVTPSGVRCIEELPEKPHLYRLLAFMGMAPTPGAFTPKSEDEQQLLSGRRVHGLREQARLLTPWNLAFALSCLCGGIAGMSLAQPPTSRLAATVAAAVAAAVLAGLLIAARSTLTRLAAILTGVVMLSALGVIAGAQRPLLVAAPCAIVAPVFVWFWAQSYETLTAGVGSSIIRSLAGATHEMLAWVVGPQTQNVAGLNSRRTWPRCARRSPSASPGD